MDMAFSRSELNKLLLHIEHEANEGRVANEEIGRLTPMLSCIASTCSKLAPHDRMVVLRVLSFMQFAGVWGIEVDLLQRDIPQLRRALFGG